MSWVPTPENINHLPEPVRKYIHDLETNCDTQFIMAENECLRQNVVGLQAMYVELKNGEKMSSQTTSYAFSEHYTAWCEKCKKFVETKVDINNGNYPQTDIDCVECGTNLLRVVRK